MPRDWTPRETRLVAEWVTQTWPAAIWKFRVDVGDLTPAMSATGLSAAELRKLGRSRRWVDAMVIEPRTVHLIEAKIRLEPGALEQLELYKELWPRTPEFAELVDRDLQLHLVYAVEDPVLTAIARRRGVQVHIYHPPWVDDYLALLQHRERRAPQPHGLQDLFPPEGESGPT